MGMESIRMKMEIFMKGNGKMIRKRDLGLFIIIIEDKLIKEIIKRESKREKVLLHGIMEINLLEHIGME